MPNHTPNQTPNPNQTSNPTPNLEPATPHKPNLDPATPHKPNLALKFLRTLARTTRHTCARVPVTFALIAMIWVAFAIGSGDRHRLMELYGLTTRGDANLLHIFSSGITSPTWTGAVDATLALLILGIVTERTLGWARYLLIVLASQAVTVTLGVGLCHALLGGTKTWSQALLHGTYLSPAAWICTTAMVASVQMSTLWRRRVRLITLVVITTLLFFTGSIAALVVFTGCLLGLLAGELVFHQGPRFLKLHQILLREQRLLVATLVACVTFVPLFVSFHATAPGPFLRAGQLIWESTNALRGDFGACQVLDSSACFNVVKVANQQGVGSGLANLLPALLQLLFTYGLLRGRRAAWIGAVVAQIANLTLIVAQFLVVDINRSELDLGIAAASLASIPWILCLVTLLLTASRFQVRSSRSAARACALIIGAGALVASLAWMIGALVLADSFTPRATWLLALQQLPSQLMPPNLYILMPYFTIPVASPGWTLSSWVAVVMWVAVVVAFVKLLVNHDFDPSHEDRARARVMLQSGTGDHLSFMTLWPGNRFFFTPQGYVAYRVHNSVAVTTGSPVLARVEDGDTGPGEDGSSDPAAQLQALAQAFENYVAAQGWTCAWYSVPADFQRPEHRRLHVAEESILTAEQVGFTGKKFQNIRTARNNAAKEGVEALWTTWGELDLEMHAKILELSEEWVDNKALPEMSFTLGTVEELKIPGTRLLLAVDQMGRLHGVTSWLPVYQDGEIRGFTLDFMRRDASGFRPVIEFLLAEALVKAVDLGLGWVSLSGAPLARSGGEAPGAGGVDATQGEAPGFLDTVLDLAGDSIEPLYGFQSLAQSKYKFHPLHQGWYLLYDDELALGAIALAVVGCYLPQLSAAEAATTAKAWVNALLARRQD